MNPEIIPLSRYPLTRRQRMVWLSQRIYEHIPLYHLVFKYDIHYDIDFNRFQVAFRRLVQSSDSLRTIINSEGEAAPHASVLHGVPVDVKFHDLSSYPNPDATMQDIIGKVAWKDFELNRCLYSSWLFKLGCQNYIWVFKVHHLVCDGVSLQLIFDRLSLLYDNPDTTLPDTTYRAYAEIEQATPEPDIDYWKQRSSDFDTEFSFYGQTPLSQIFKTERFDYQLKPIHLNVIDKLTSQKDGYGLSKNARRFSFFATLLGIYLSKCGVNKKPTIAMGHHGRLDSETLGIIGLFSQILPLSVEIYPTNSFSSLIGHYKKEVATILNHPRATLANSVHARTMHASLNYRVSKFGVLGNKPVEFTRIGSDWSEFCLVLNVYETSERGVTISLEISRELLNLAQRRIAANNFFCLLKELLVNPDRLIEDISLLSAKERQRVLVDWNATQADYPHDHCVHDLFERQVERSPEEIALICKNQKVTYRELNSRSNRIAHKLIDCGIKTNDLIGLHVYRDIDSIIGLLAILKAGAAYVPLDPNDPTARKNIILEDTSAAVILTNHNSNFDLPKSINHVINIGEAIVDEALPITNPINTRQADDILYCLYTSGTTGVPKGVLGSHRGSVNTFAWLWREYPYVQEEIACQKTSLCFVDFVWELFCPMLAGVPTIIVPEIVVNDPRQLVSFLAKFHITRLVAVPSLLSRLIEIGTVPNELRICFSSGEPLSSSLCLRLRNSFPKTRLVNLYGSTEGAGIATYWEYRSGETNPLIGRPISNTFVRILDLNQKIVPIGVWGELCVGGVGLAHGYLNRPELTAEKFISDTFINNNDSYLYTTGDIARYLPEGDIEYQGRLDQQIKIRGFRIELGEIENTLGQIPEILSSVVVAHEASCSDKQLVAYCVTRDGQVVSTSKIRQLLKDYLPAYMVPTHFVFLSKLPVTQTGKIDRRKLKSMEPGLKGSSTPSFIESNLETTIKKVWKKYLKVTSITVTDNFFDMGGHSLLAAQVLSELEELLNRTIPLGILFEAQTVRELSEALENAEDTEYLPSSVKLHSGHSEITVFIAPTVGGALYRYRHMIRYLNQEYTIVGLQMDDLKINHQSPINIERIAQSLINTVRQSQESGPYYLTGFCFGGVLALEMARQLERQGDLVGFLGLIDTYAPRYLDRLDFHPNSSRRTIVDLAMRLDFHFQATRILRGKERIQYVFRKLGRRTGIDNKLTDPLDSNNVSSHANEMMDRNIQAFRSYLPSTYLGEVTLFRSRHSLPSRVDRYLGWGEWLRGQVHVIDTPGFHTFILEEPWVRVLGAKMNKALDQAQHKYSSQAKST